MGNPSNADFSFHVRLLARYKQVDSKDGFLWLAIDGIGEIGATQASTKTGAPKRNDVLVYESSPKKTMDQF